MKSEEILKEYFPEVTDVNQNETITIFPLTLNDMLIEFGEKCFKAGRDKESKVFPGHELTMISHKYATFENYLNETK